METLPIDSASLDALVGFLGGAEALDRKARETKAFLRARGLANAVDLVRLAMMWAPGGHSLRSLASTAAADGVAQLSDPAVFKRLRGAADLLESLCRDALEASAAERAPAAVQTAPAAGPRPLRLVDASRLEGPDGRCFRLHMAYDPHAARILEAKITAMTTGESFARFQPQQGDIVIGDRGYGQPDGLRHLLDAGADVIVRLTWNSLKLADRNARPLDWLALLRAAKHAERLDIPVLVHKARGRFAPIPMRLVIIEKPPEAAAKARRQAQHASRKNRRRTDPRTLAAADFVMLLTSLPEDTYAPAAVAELYRLRWQIELAFKRLKSILHIDRLPAKDADSARTWLHAHLLLALYVDRVQDSLDAFSP